MPKRKCSSFPRFSAPQITELAGCALLTISADLLQKLGETDAPVTRKPSAETAQSDDLEKLAPGEKSFRAMLNGDAMGIEKPAEGICQFCADTVKPEKLVDALR